MRLGSPDMSSTDEHDRFAHSLRGTLPPSLKDEDLTAIREAIAEWRAGDPGMPLDDAFEQVRRSVGNRDEPGRR